MNGGLVSNHEVLERYMPDAKMTVTKFLKEDFGHFNRLPDYNALIQLEPGEVSGAFLTEDMLSNQMGKIVKLVEVIPAHTASLNEDYLRLEEMALHRQAGAGLQGVAFEEDRRHVRLYRPRVPRRGVREQTLGEVVRCAGSSP